MFSKILNYKIYNLNKQELLKFIIKNESKVHIVSGNPEILMNGLTEQRLLENFNLKSSIIIPDGVGTVLASKIVRQPVSEKIAGIEVMEEVIKFCENNGKAIYLLGAKQEVLKSCTVNLINKYPELQITGSRNGYFNIEDCNSILEDIKNKKPFVLFVAMGSPRQEIFIHKYMEELPCTIFMGVGGSFDVFAGNTKRAPKWMIKLGIEWLYRVLKEPWRIKRLSSIPRFLLTVIKHTYF